MTLTTVEVYTVDGVDLNTYAWNLQTLTGRQSTPPVIGENRRVVGRPGASWQRKDFGEKTETWAMWVLGCDEDGLFPVEHSRRAQLNANLEALKLIFGVRHRQLALQKQLVMPDGVRTYSALGEVIDAIEPDSTAGGTRATFSVSMQLADPFWYLPQVEAEVEPSGATITNPGTAIASKLGLLFEGPLTFPELENTTTGVKVRLNRSLSSGQSVLLDTDLFTAVDNLAQNVIADVYQYGSDWWMELVPGDNVMTLTNSNGGSVGSGSVTVTFLPPNL